MIIYLYPMPDVSFREREALLRYVSAERRERILRLGSDTIKSSSLCAALLARMAVSHYAGVPAESLIFGAGEKGKPYCLNAGCEFSFSHTKSMVVCAVSPAPVGADAEMIKPAPSKVMRYFTVGEREYILGGRGEERFFRVWTRKEAYGKMTGEGIFGGALRTDTMSAEFSSQAHTFVYGGYVVSVFGRDIGNLCVTKLTEEDIREFYIHRE